MNYLRKCLTNFEVYNFMGLSINYVDKQVGGDDSNDLGNLDYS